MDETMLASFYDELEKMAESNAAVSSSPAVGEPASVSSGIDVTKAIKSSSKSPVKPTNYSVVHNQSAQAAVGTANAAKAVPPPPVRA